MWRAGSVSDRRGVATSGRLRSRLAVTVQLQRTTSAGSALESEPYDTQHFPTGRLTVRRARGYPHIPHFHITALADPRSTEELSWTPAPSVSSRRSGLAKRA